MIDMDILYAKVGNIHNCLRRIREVTHLEPERLKNIDTQDIFVLNLQRAVHSAIDLSAHVVAAEELGLPTSLKENFLLLERAEIIDEPLATRMISMVGFRNIAVHDYQKLEVAVLEAILAHHLKDLEDFTHSLLNYYQSPE